MNNTGDLEKATGGILWSSTEPCNSHQQQFKNLKRRRIKVGTPDSELDKSAREFLSAIRENPIKKRTNLCPLPAINSLSTNTDKKKKEDIKLCDDDSTSPYIITDNDMSMSYAGGNASTSKSNSRRCNKQRLNNTREATFLEQIMSNSFGKEDGCKSSDKSAENSFDPNFLRNDDFGSRNTKASRNRRQTEQLPAPDFSDKFSRGTKSLMHNDKKPYSPYRSDSRNSTPTRSVAIRNLSLCDDIIPTTPTSPMITRSKLPKHRRNKNEEKETKHNLDYPAGFQRMKCTDEILPLFSNENNLGTGLSQRRNNSTVSSNGNETVSASSSHSLNIQKQSSMWPDTDEDCGILTSPKRHRTRSDTKGKRRTISDPGLDNYDLTAVISKVGPYESNYDPLSLCRTAENNNFESRADILNGKRSRIPHRRSYKKYLPPLSEDAVSKPYSDHNVTRSLPFEE